MFRTLVVALIWAALAASCEVGPTITTPGECDTDAACGLECDSHDDCANPATPTCATDRRCMSACLSNSACARFAATPTCDEATGRCVAGIPGTTHTLLFTSAILQLESGKWAGGFGPASTSSNAKAFAELGALVPSGATVSRVRVLVQRAPGWGLSLHVYGNIVSGNLLGDGGSFGPFYASTSGSNEWIDSGAISLRAADKATTIEIESGASGDIVYAIEVTYSDP